MNWPGRKRSDASIRLHVHDKVITISGEALEALLEVANREHLTVPEVLARAIAIEKAVADAKAEGRKVFIERKGDTPLELVGV